MQRTINPGPAGRSVREHAYREKVKTRSELSAPHLIPLHANLVF